MVKEFTNENFETEVLQSEIPVLVDFYAEWCGPCNLAAPIVEQLAEEYEGKIVIGKLNVDGGADIPMKYGIMSIPTFVVFKKGEVIGKTMGVQTKKTLEHVINRVL